MKLSRPSRLVAACIALISILFMQFAVASYACPGLGMEQVSVSAGTSESVPACHDANMAQPSLCHAHYQSGNQSLDKPELPHVQPFAPVGLAMASHTADIAYRPVTLPETALLTRTTAPPLSIRNCCFRI